MIGLRVRYTPLVITPLASFEKEQSAALRNIVRSCFHKTALGRLWDKIYQH